MTRVCKRCKTERPLTDYHKVALCKDGRRPVCVPCVKDENKVRRESDIEGARRGARERTKRYRETHPAPAPTRERMRDWEQRNPEKVRAHWKVKDALRSGVLVKEPCEVCRAPNAHAHHDDYSQPLNVRWLCRAHHMEAHRLPIGEQS